jgi:hypothetical protein
MIMHGNAHVIANIDRFMNNTMLLKFESNRKFNKVAQV